MKRKIFLTLSSFVPGLLAAQLTILSTDMPNAGDQVLVSVANSAGTNDPTIAGANFNLDYSFLTPTVQRYEKFDNPLNFTSPFNLLFNPFNTSYGKDNYTFTTIPLPGVTITAAYDFIKESSSQLKQIGAGYTINGAPIPFLYSSADVIYKFPMNYLNTDSCDYKYGLPIPTIGYYGQTGHRVNEIDGWGTLITPYGTFQTLRVKSAISAIDTIYATNFGIGTKISRPLKYEFKWLATGKKVPVLQIDANVVGGSLQVTNVVYLDSIRTGVPQVGIVENETETFNMTVYPNPCEGLMVLQYSLLQSAVVKITISDIVGKTLASMAGETQAAGLQRKSIKTSDFGLSPGVYLIKLQANGYQKTQKIILSK